MSLVAYDSNDSSEHEDEDESTPVEAIINRAKSAQASTLLQSEDRKPAEIILDDSNLFNVLPQPTTIKQGIIEEDDEFLHKKEKANISKPKAKITVPSLSDFKDVEGSAASTKPKLPCEKKSGLLSILPQPKNGVTKATTKSFIPNVLTSKSNKLLKKKETLPPFKGTTIVKEDSDDSDNDDEVQNDFFSINKPKFVPTEEIPLGEDSFMEEIPRTNEKKPINIESFFKKEEPVNQTDSETVGGSYGNHGNGYEATPNSEEVTLDDEAILKLCGTRGKRKREDIQIVDVNQRDVLGDSRDWLLKGLMDDTTKRVSASKKRGDEPTSQQRRKHQITYLAHQAKANESELQNQWANNRLSKRKTQSKYGF